MTAPFMVLAINWGSSIKISTEITFALGKKINLHLPVDPKGALNL